MSRFNAGKVRGFYRISNVYADIILLAQVLGLAANVSWALQINRSDWVGFMYVGGDIAGLLAYFGFFFFGFFNFFLNPTAFWHTIHPINFGLAIILLSTHRIWGSDPAGIVVAGIAGVAAAAVLGLGLRRYGRSLIISCVLLIAIGRYGLPHAMLPYAAAWFGFLLLSFSSWFVFFNRQRLANMAGGH